MTPSNHPPDPPPPGSFEMDNDDWWHHEVIPSRLPSARPSTTSLTLPPSPHDSSLSAQEPSRSRTQLRLQTDLPPESVGQGHIGSLVDPRAQGVMGAAGNGWTPTRQGPGSGARTPTKGKLSIPLEDLSASSTVPAQHLHPHAEHMNSQADHIHHPQVAELDASSSQWRAPNSSTPQTERGLSAILASYADSPTLARADSTSSVANPHLLSAKGTSRRNQPTSSIYSQLYGAHDDDIPSVPRLPSFVLPDDASEMPWDSSFAAAADDVPSAPRLHSFALADVRKHVRHSSIEFDIKRRSSMPFSNRRRATSFYSTAPDDRTTMYGAPSIYSDGGRQSMASRHSGWWSHLSIPFRSQRNTLNTTEPHRSALLPEVIPVMPPLAAVAYRAQQRAQQAAAGGSTEPRPRTPAKDHPRDKDTCPGTPQSATSVASDAWWDNRNTINGMPRFEVRRTDDESGFLPFMLSRPGFDGTPRSTRDSSTTQRTRTTHRAHSVQSALSRSDRFAPVMLDIESMPRGPPASSHVSFRPVELEAPMDTLISYTSPHTFAGENTHIPPRTPAPDSPSSAKRWPRAAPRVLVSGYNGFPRVVAAVAASDVGSSSSSPTDPSPISSRSNGSRERTPTHAQQQQQPWMYERHGSSGRGSPGPGSGGTGNGTMPFAYHNDSPISSHRLDGYDTKESEIMSSPHREKMQSMIYGTTPSMSTPSMRPTHSSVAHDKDSGDHSSPGCLTTCGLAGPTNRRRRRIWIIITLAFWTLVILAVILAVLLPRHLMHAAATKAAHETQWLNLTTYPAIWKSAASVGNLVKMQEIQGCVVPNTLWSCEFPPSGGGWEGIQLVVEWDNSSSSTTTTRRSAAVDDILTSWQGKRSTTNFTSDPLPPELPEQFFLGDTTDGIISAQKAGELTPFYISVAGVEGAGGVQKRGVWMVDGVDGPDDEVSLGNELRQHAELQHHQLHRRQTTPASPSTSATITPSTTIPPAPTTNPLHPTLLAQPTSQPLRLYDRGLPSEHYGFYTYFEKRIFLRDLDISPGTGEADVGGVEPTDAKWLCTWPETRFLVRIWTRGNSSATSTSSATSATTSTSPPQIPYPFSLTLDRHGGLASSKGLFCYAVSQGVVAADTVGVAWKEDRAYVPASDAQARARSLVNPAEGGGGAGGSDGGVGGCACVWGRG